MTTFAVQRDGRDATTEDLTPLAFASYAHLTAAQVRDRRIRGLDLHLDRLRTASLELFGQALPDEQVLSYVSTALASGPADVSLMVTVYPRVGDYTAAEAALSVLVRTGPPASGPPGPLALATVHHERTLPALKHVGEFAKTYYLRQAVARGFDDAAFVDGDGRLSEGSIWNLAFWDDSAVVWPEAPMLVGSMMNIVRRQLDRLGVAQSSRPLTVADLTEMRGAVVMNSWTPGILVNRIDEVSLPEAEDFLALLHKAHAAEPLTAP